MATKKKKQGKRKQQGPAEAPRPPSEFERVAVAFLGAVLLVLLFVSIEVASVMVFLLRIITKG